MVLNGQQYIRLLIEIDDSFDDYFPPLKMTVMAAEHKTYKFYNFKIGMD